MSKLAVSTWTRVLAQELKPRGIAVNACCPGWVATDMSSNRGTKTPAEGADTPVWLALQPPAERPEELVTGGLWGERREYQF
jgi:carbonyl reductase 1